MLSHSAAPLAPLARSRLRRQARTTFGTVFLLAQARYYFPAINAAALLAMLGLRALVSPRWLGATQMVVIAGIIAINVVIYTSNVVPYFYFRP